MEIKALFLHNFRNYADEEFLFSSGINLIEGANAQGKTALLEAIYLLSTGRSFRTHHLQELIRLSTPSFFIELHFEKEGVSHIASIDYNGKERHIRINQSRFSLFGALLGLIPSVIYAPTDVSLVSGSPLERRHFLDVHIAQADPLYVHHLTRYTKAMKQRNCLLKEKKADTIVLWEHVMAESGSYIIKKRNSSLKALQEPFHEMGLLLSSNEDIHSVAYENNYKELNVKDIALSLKSAFEKNRSKEQIIGFTLVGPHRDDILFSINGKLAKHFASEGQKRTLVAALRLAEWTLLKQELGFSPLFSIDDFGIHLDEKRSLLLEEKIVGCGQVFITSAKALSLDVSYRIKIEAGTQLREPVSTLVKA